MDNITMDDIRRLQRLREMLDRRPNRFYRCVMCRAPFTEANVHTDAGWRETQISGTCENCFDALFAEK